MTGTTATPGAVAQPSPPAAYVAGRPVTVPQVTARLARMRSGPAATLLPADGCTEGRQLGRWVLQLLVAELLVEVEYARLGVQTRLDAAAEPDRPILADRTAALEVGSVMSALLASSAAARALFRAVTAECRVSDGEVAGYYRRNPELFTRAEARDVRHVLLSDAATATHVHTCLRAGADFSAVAAQFSTDPGSAHRGGRLGSLRQGDLTGPLGNAAFTAARGRLTPPVQTTFGWHVLRVDHVHPGGTVPLAEVEDDIRTMLTDAARRRAFVQWWDLQYDALVRLAPGHEHPADPRQPDATHRH